MNDIYIQDDIIKYQVDQKIGLIHCKEIIILVIFGETKVFHGGSNNKIKEEQII